MKAPWLLFATLLFAPALYAQSSASYTLGHGQFNSGGTGAQAMQSAQYRAFGIVGQPAQYHESTGATLRLSSGAGKAFCEACAVVSVGVDAQPGTFRLHQNYPNPFNPGTVIVYELERAGMVELSVYDVLGTRVALLYSGRAQAGRHELRFDATRLPSGVYLYRLQTDEGQFTRRMVVAR